MAKPLREAQPSSSVARLLDLGAAARAIVKEEVKKEPEEPTRHQSGDLAPLKVAQPTGETPNVKCQVLLTPSADKTFTRLVEVYRLATGTKLTASHVVRALLTATSHCMEQLEKRAKRIGPLKLPSNARGKELERERFEARIADAFIAGIRNSAAMDDE